MKKNTAFLAIVICSLSILTGCEWWNSKPTNLEENVQTAQKILDETRAEVSRWKADIEALKNQPNLTAEEAALLAKMEAQLVRGDSIIEDIQATANQAKAELANAETNGDVVVATASAVAAAFGVPFVGLFAGFLKRGTAFRSLIDNIGQAKISNDEGKMILDSKRLELLNMTSGIEKKIQTLREQPSS